MRDEQKKIIKDICIEFGYTQIELAEKIGVSEGAINQWSSGLRKIPKYFYKFIDLLRKIKSLS